MSWDWAQVKDIIYWFSDGSLNDFAALVVKDFKVLALIIGGPVVWVLKRWVKLTPWTTDDDVAEIVEEKLGLRR